MARPGAEHGGATTQTNNADVPDFRVAIDFGTTFTTIAFTNCKRGNDVYTIEGFPGDRLPGRNGTQVPTEILYLSDSEDAAAGKTPECEIPKALCGYEIERRLELPEDDPVHVACKNRVQVTKPKLLLDDSAHLRDLKKSLQDVLQKLKNDRIIKKNEDVIRHLLIYFLNHTKYVLERNHCFNDASKVEMTLAVPVCWSARTSAVMSSCLLAAMASVNFGADSDKNPQLFIVNEAEAAATHALESRSGQIRLDECFVLLDCGGGTTDVGTYTTANARPLRLSEEVNRPRGAVCGSGDLNERMRLFAVQSLQHETYLKDLSEGITIESIVDTEIMPKFEDHIKRTFDITRDETFSVVVRGLKHNPQNPRVRRNLFVLKSEDLHLLFDESLSTIGRLMLEQIEDAQRNGVGVSKVLLAGGFGDSPALQDYLRTSLNYVNTRYQTNIELVVAQANTSAPGVAIGALRRAGDKEHGPKRIPRLSIGVLYHVPDNPEKYDADVLSQKWSYSDLSQEEYIMRTLRWIIKAGMGELQVAHDFEFEGMYPFSPDDLRWVAEEELYASETCVDDYYTRSHIKNRGKTYKFGVVEFDLTHLKDQMETLIPPVNENGSDHFQVTLRIHMRVIDRHLEFAAYWPANDANAEAIRGSQKCFDISSAFKPGTA